MRSDAEMRRLGAYDELVEAALEQDERQCNRMIGPYPCCSVVQGDCLELMRDMPDGVVDLVITSPPYDAARDYANGYSFTPETWFPAVARVLAKTGSLAFNIASTYEPDGGESLTPYLCVLDARKCELRLKQHHVYFRHGRPGPMWELMRKNRVDHEHIFHFCKSPREIKSVGSETESELGRSQGNGGHNGKAERWILIA